MWILEQEKRTPGKNLGYLNKISSLANNTINYCLIDSLILGGKCTMLILRQGNLEMVCMECSIHPCNFSVNPKMCQEVMCPCLSSPLPRPSPPPPGNLVSSLSCVSFKMCSVCISRKEIFECPQIASFPSYLNPTYCRDMDSLILSTTQVNALTLGVPGSCLPPFPCRPVSEGTSFTT